MKVEPIIKLKPCPFCGGKAEISTCFHPDYPRGMIMVRCKNCKARSLTFGIAFNMMDSHETTLDEGTKYVARAWNRSWTH